LKLRVGDRRNRRLIFPRGRVGEDPAWRGTRRAVVVLTAPPCKACFFHVIFSDFLYSPPCIALTYTSMPPLAASVIYQQLPQESPFLKKTFCSQK